MGTVRVKQHLKRDKKGKVVYVRGYSKQTTDTKSYLKQVAGRQESAKRTKSDKVDDKLKSLVKKRVKSKKGAEMLLSFYKEQPSNLNVMVNGKWKNVPITSWSTNKDGKREQYMSIKRQLNFTNKQWTELINQNSGLLHKIASKWSFNPEMYEDLKAVAVKAVFDAANNYEGLFNPENPPLLHKSIASQAEGYVRAEQARQLAVRFSLPHQKRVIYNKFKQAYDEFGADYDAIYDKLKLTKKDLYPAIDKNQANDPLPKEGYVSVKKEGVLDSKTAKYQENINDLKTKYDEDKNMLSARVHGGITEEDKIAYDSAEKQIDKQIERLHKKGKSEDEINELEKRKELLHREIKPLDEETYKKKLVALDKNNQDNIRELKQKFQKDIGKTTLQGAFPLFKELEDIMSFKSVNVSGEKDFGDGDVATMESVIQTPNVVDPERKIIIRTSFITNLEKFNDAIDSLDNKTAKVLRMHLGLDELNEQYVHGLWGVPMENVSEIVRNLPKGLYPRVDSDDVTHRSRIRSWKEKEPTKTESRKRTPAEVKAKMKEVKSWEGKRKRARAFISKNIAKVKGSDAKSKFRDKVYKKYNATMDKKPFDIKYKKVRLSKTAYDTKVKKWKASKPTAELGEHSLIPRVTKDLEYGRIALNQIVPKKLYKELMYNYSDMRAYNIRKGHLVEDLKKSLVVDKFFNHTVRYEKETIDDGIIKKAYNKVKDLFKLLVS